jgi:hypothetical protein
MLKLLERNVDSVERRLVVLAPQTGHVSRGLPQIQADSDRHADLLAELQRLRGSVYTQDGAIRPDQLTADGRHQTPDDSRSWHMVMLNEQGQVGGCIWYLEHEGRPTVDQLRAGRSELARQGEWRDKLKIAIDSETARARREGIGYAEVGGWAVAENSRFADCLLLILGIYSLSQQIGGALVVATATARHSSAGILRRMGGSPLTGQDFVIPSYYDPQYTCQMEMLRFDTRRPGAKFEGFVRQMRGRFSGIPVISRETLARPSRILVRRPARAAA